MTYTWYWFICSLVLFMEESRDVYAEHDIKYVCSGDSIQLFQNITINSIDKVVSLYINASKNRLIAMWTLQTLPNGTITDGYSRKVFLDKYGDLWIRNVYSSDEAQYMLMNGGSTFVTSLVYLSILAPPTMNCKPKIQRLDDVLSASLEANECGKPLASVEWLDYPGIHHDGEGLLMLPRQNNAGTYYACISGPAVRCARTSKVSDYCSAFTIDDSHYSHDTSSEPGVECNLPKYVLVAQIFIYVLLFLGLMVLFLSKYMNFTICLTRTKATNVGKSDYDAVPTDIALLGIKVDKERKIIFISGTESYSLQKVSEQDHLCRCKSESTI